MKPGLREGNRNGEQQLAYDVSRQVRIALTARDIYNTFNGFLDYPVTSSYNKHKVPPLLSIRCMKMHGSVPYVVKQMEISYIMSCYSATLRPLRDLMGKVSSRDSKKVLRLSTPRAEGLRQK